MLLASSMEFGNVGHRAGTQLRGSQHPCFSKPLPHSDLTRAATGRSEATGPFFHLDNAFALLPFLPPLRQNT